MKTRELMIGDWVFVDEYDEYTPAPHNKPYPVQILHGADIDRADEVSFRPIPLTAEILEKNGFISYPQDRIVIWRKDGSFAIECDLTTWNYYWANGDVEINYVHELQHALRLCGLTELADNFKI